MINRLKNGRRVATRYDQTADSFLGFAALPMQLRVASGDRDFVPWGQRHPESRHPGHLRIGAAPSSAGSDSWGGARPWLGYATTMTRLDPLPALRAAAEALAMPDQPDAFFASLQGAMADAIGHRLFTIMRHDPEAGRNRRAFSSDPAAYPVSGFKPVDWQHPWAHRVLIEGKAWIGRDAADIAWAYPDHEKIAGMGLASAMNLPVRWNGRTLGTVNLLHGPEHFTEADATIGAIFAALAVPALLAVPAAA